jgi:hypothetical protein
MQITDLAIWLGNVTWKKSYSPKKFRADGSIDNSLGSLLKMSLWLSQPRFLWRTVFWLLFLSCLCRWVEEHRAKNKMKVMGLITCAEHVGMLRPQEEFFSSELLHHSVSFHESCHSCPITWLNVILSFISQYTVSSLRAGTISYFCVPHIYWPFVLWKLEAPRGF